MSEEALRAVLAKISVDDSEADAIFSALLPVLGESLQCDRVFLYLRSPRTRYGRISHCWLSTPDYPDLTHADWKLEPESLPDEDPLFAAALRTAPSIFVEDVETAPPEVVNKAFEHDSFGHRALIHAHLCFDGELWGVLQPCVFGKPRVWTGSDRSIIAEVTDKIVPLAVAYVKSANI